MPRTRPRRSLRLLVGLVLAAGCGERRPGDPGSRTELVSFYPEEISGLDLLFVIDNSEPMEQKQQSLGWAFPRLLEALRLPSRKSFHHRLPPRVMIAATRPAQEDFFSPISDRTTVAFG